MITIDQKREACIKYETDWLHESAEWNSVEDIIRNGWQGWNNMTDDQVEKFYKDHIEEEVR